MGSYKVNKSFLGRFRQRGLTLIEAAMVLAIVTLVIASIMLFFQSASNNNKTNATLSQIAAVQSAVQALYNGQADYTGLNTAVIAAAKVLPSKMVSGAFIKHSFNDDLTVEAATPANQYTMTIVGIPVEPCIRLMTQDLGRGMALLAANGNAGHIQRAATPSEALAECGVAGSATDDDSTIVWTFF
jgi:type II secretory pathway pseudopilin PulG